MKLISESSLTAHGPPAALSQPQAAGLIRVSDPNGFGSAIVRITSQPGCPVPKFISLPSASTECRNQQTTKEVPMQMNGHIL